MPYFPSNRPLPIAAQDEAFLWQLEVRPQSWSTNGGSQNMRQTLPQQVNSEGRTEATSLESIRTNIRQLGEGFEGYVLRRERRDARAPLEGTPRVHGEAAVESRQEGGPVDLEAAERDRLIQLASTIHNDLNSLQGGPTGAVGNPRNMSAADRLEWVQSIRRAARESLQSALP